MNLVQGVASRSASLLLGLGVWGWVFKLALVLRCVVRLTASWESRLGRLLSERIVASRFLGLEVGVKVCIALKMCRAADCAE